MNMPTRYDKYRFSRSMLEAAAQAVQSVLGLTLTQRSSSYRGIYYCGGLRLGECAYMVFEKEGRIYLHVNDVDDMDGIQDRLLAQVLDLELLETVVIESKDDGA
jgi:hypothetical protein